MIRLAVYALFLFARLMAIHAFPVQPVSKQHLSLSQAPVTELRAAPGEFEKRMREDEIRMKINQLRKSGRLKGSGESQAMKDSMAFFNKESPLEKYADKIKAAQAKKNATATSAMKVASSKERLEGYSSSSATTNSTKRTSGIGGSWSPEDVGDENSTSSYVPTRGSWGAFERPKDISKAFGGGKRIGAGVTKTDAEIQKEREKEQSTAERLKAYRENAGLVVESETANMKEINETLIFSKYCMRRGLYNKAVEALENITEYCSQNSKMGSQVFLELAMALEATGCTENATMLYTSLANSCKQPDVKRNAKQLLYGLEAMDFLRIKGEDIISKNEAKKAQYVDVSVLSRLSDFDDRSYSVTYVNKDKGSTFYNELTKNVIRTKREARLVLLQAKESGDVASIRVIQALNKLSRDFAGKIASKKLVGEVKYRQVESGDSRSDSDSDSGMENTADGELPASLIKSSLEGEWKLQLTATKTSSESIVYYQKAWQVFEKGITEMALSYTYSVPVGLFKNYKETSGVVKIGKEQRLSFRRGEEIGGGGILGGGVGGETFLSEVVLLLVDDSLLVLQDQEGSGKKGRFYVFHRSESDELSGAKGRDEQFMKRINSS